MKVSLTRNDNQWFYTWHIVDNDGREIAFKTSEVRDLVAELKRLLSIAEKHERCER